MLLSADPSLAEVPDVSPQQLSSLTASVERKQQQLEADINDYIKRKQDELRSYGRELVELYRRQGRAMECAAPSTASDSRHLKESPPSAVPQTSKTTISPEKEQQQEQQSADASTEVKNLGSSETAKRTKHTRVHKREKELYGLVTPIFLPLLASGDSSPAKKKSKEKKRQKEEESAKESGSSPQKSDPVSSPPRDADKSKEQRRKLRSKRSEEKMERGGDGVVIGGVGGEGTLGDKSHSDKDAARSPEPSKKSKSRSAVKKSSLRHVNSRSRRKRVSLVIDDQIVTPTDEVIEPPLTSPSETTTASNSTTSLDDMIDPRLISRHDTPVHQDPVHHSLPMPMGVPSMQDSPNQHTGHNLPPSPSLDYETPQTATRTYLDPPPSQLNSHDAISIPQHASASPIYANSPELADELESAQVETIDEYEDRMGLASSKGNESDFDTYVGGIDGSGVDDVNQVGSYGYPSSLGASYLESYMQNRPLSVRMAAEKAGAGDDGLVMSTDKEKENRRKREREEKERKDRERRKREKQREEDDVDVRVESVRVKEVDEDMEIIGDMEGF